MSKKRIEYLNNQLATLLFNGEPGDYVANPEKVVWKASSIIQKSMRFYRISLTDGRFQIRLEPLKNGKVDREHVVTKYVRLVEGKEAIQICSVIVGVFEKYRKYILEEAL